jgi:hypothetical protein
MKYYFYLKNKQSNSLFVFSVYYRNISTPLWQQEMSDWDAETLEDLLNMTYLKNVSEATLFKRLMA